MKNLPITEALPALLSALNTHDQVVLEAPPGAGKTTAVPLALLEQNWLGSQKILLLEPRRIAVKSAAIRLAQNLNEQVGQQVGYRMRQESNVSARSKIEVITEGILTRMLQEDPSLEGIGLIIFDEFHERSLNNDLNLALCLEGRALFRDNLPLKILLMSATLDGAASAELLGNAPIVKSKGRSFAVEIRYSAYVAQSNTRTASVPERVSKLVLQALSQQSGSLLVFLPGQREIRAVEQWLMQNIELMPEGVEITPLYGSLPFAQQQRAIQAVDKTQRKVVLATNIAETSITIEGITTVIDSGLCRRALYDANTGLTRLTSQKISQASSDQRAGRAGRTAPGVCYRLWSEDQQQSLAPFETPEILSADLSHLVLNLYLWGNSNALELKWLNPPRASQLQQAEQLLFDLGALTSSEQTQLSAHGEKMCALPMPPRLAHLCISAARLGLAELGCDIAALLGEGDPLQERSTDLQRRLQALANTKKHNSSQWQRVRVQARQYKALIERLTIATEHSANSLSEEQRLALLIAIAWPERIAQRRACDSNQYKLANGRAANLFMSDHLQKSEYLAIANCGGREGQQTDQIYLACPLDNLLFESHLSALLKTEQVLLWDDKSERIKARQQQSLGKLILSSQHVSDIDLTKKRQLILSLIEKRGLTLLPWNKNLLQLRDRVNFLRQQSADTGWPNLTDSYLLANLKNWLAPYISDSFVSKFTQLTQLQALDLTNIMQNLLPWPLPTQLESQAPVSFKVPSGSKVAIDYSQNPPVLAVKLQEMFGCTSTPTIASQSGKGVALQLHLLSPARKPLQITQDIANFWHSSYIDVKKEMKGKYPRHPWPDDPMNFAPTKKTNRKLAQEKR